MQTDSIKTLTIGDTDYQIYPIPAVKQFQILRRLGPILARPLLQLLPTLLRMLSDESGHVDEKEKEEVLKTVFSALPDVATGLASLSDEDVEYVIYNCLDYCWKRQEKGWARLRQGGVMMFADLDMGTMIRLVIEAIKANMTEVFSTGQPKASTASPLA
jgi:hypothetical protein